MCLCVSFFFFFFFLTGIVWKEIKAFHRRGLGILAEAKHLRDSALALFFIIGVGFDIAHYQYVLVCCFCLLVCLFICLFFVFVFCFCFCLCVCVGVCVGVCVCVCVCVCMGVGVCVYLKRNAPVAMNTFMYLYVL